VKAPSEGAFLFCVVTYEVEEEDLSGIHVAQILIDPKALIEFIGAEVADIAR
jgi:hypothetical protein